MSARMKLRTQSPRSGGGKAIYHDVPPEHVFHSQQHADNADDDKGTSYSSSLCLVCGVSSCSVSRCPCQVVCPQAVGADFECCCSMAFKPEK